MLAWYLYMRPLGIEALKIKMQEITGVVSRKRGFADAAQAKVFCDKVKAKGGQCTVVDS